MNNFSRSNCSLADIAPIIGTGTPQHNHNVQILLTDSRSLTKPEVSLFFAISTPTNDGHRYVESLYRQGVRSFVVEKIMPEWNDLSEASFMVVNNSVKALQQIARACRDKFSGTVVSITGSRGKTTLKEWLFQLLEPLCNVQRSPRSYNSQIGVPLSLWELDSNADIAIIEAGISKSGEMEALKNCIRPDVVIFTNVSDPHAEGFSSIQQKATEKVELADNDSTRLIVYCADSKLIDDAVKQLPASATRRIFKWSQSSDNTDVQINRTDNTDGNNIIVKYNGITQYLHAPVMNDADFENTANAISFMLATGYDFNTIRQQFATLHKIGTRLNVSDGLAGCSIIHDSYTSDFSSLAPALDFMRRRAMPNQQQVLILSDLRHETSNEDILYKEIASLVANSHIRRFIGVGPIISKHASLFGKNASFYESTSQLLENLTPSDFTNEIILLKGAPEFEFGRIKEMLEARTHETVLEVNLDALVKNYNYFRDNVPQGTDIICMVKASGYGAGSREIAKTLQDCGAAYVAVAVLDEGIDLRNHGITMPIMVMNPRVVNYKVMFEYNLEPEIYSFDMLRDMIREAKKNGITDYPVHIKLDTGMHRMGFIEDELPELMSFLNTNPEVRASSVFSHLATADCPDMDDYTRLQLNRFADATNYMIDNYPYPIKRHILNSAGILRFPQFHYDMVRLGIGLYGANTLPAEIEKPLDTVSTLRTVIIAIREWNQGESVGYARKGRLNRTSRIATIPIGYADGMNRHFGNGAISVLINGKQAPTIGNICMDACMIDVTDIDCKVGDSVEIFGQNNNVQRLADVLGTIPYEVLTSVSPRVKRIYYRE